MITATPVCVHSQHHGFFTPLLHISVLTGSPASMMHAATGDNFSSTRGAALAGLVIHMVTGALYGLAVFGVSAFVALPVVAAITGAGSSVSDVASMVGYGTFVLEHLVYGTTLGVLVLLASPRVSAHARADRVPCRPPRDVEGRSGGSVESHVCRAGFIVDVVCTPGQREFR